MKIIYNQNYHLDVTLDQVPDKPLYLLKITRIDPEAANFSRTEEYYFEPHQLKQLVDFFAEIKV